MATKRSFEDIERDLNEIFGDDISEPPAHSSGLPGTSRAHQSDYVQLEEQPGPSGSGQLHHSTAQAEDSIALNSDEELLDADDDVL